MDFYLRPVSFLLIMAAGFLLKRAGVFREGAHRVVSKAVLTLTLPAVIVRSFAVVERETSLFFLVLFGFLAAALPLVVMCVLTRRHEAPQRAFFMINTSGFNVGCFALPLVEGFFGAAGAATACMFDVGNALIMTGGSYALTSTLLHTEERPARLSESGEHGRSPILMQVLRKLLSSVPIDTYLVMIILTLFGVTLPAQILAIIEPVAEANSFLAMLMVGLMFELPKSHDYLTGAAWVTGLRLVFSVLLAAAIYWWIPFPLLTRQILVVLVFSPIGSLAPVYTEQCGGDGALSSFSNSVSVLLSLLLMTLLASVMGAG